LDLLLETVVVLKNLVELGGLCRRAALGVVLNLSLLRLNADQLASETVDLLQQQLPFLGEVTLDFVQFICHVLLGLLVTLLGLPQ